MGPKTKYFIVGALVALAFASGRYLTPTKTITVTKVVEVKSTDTQTHQDDHKTVVIVKKPDGETTTTITDNKTTDTEQQVTDVTKTETTKEVTHATSNTSISILSGIDVHNPGAGLSYGAHISRNLLGPVSIGAWGISSGSGGISLGINF